jgi:NAD(P)-dependent dehydrogenase (short-subunit alcohol dehydrogenase family)
MVNSSAASFPFSNLYGALRVTQTVLPLMRKNNYGRIVNMSSGLGQLCEMHAGTPPTASPRRRSMR